MAGTTVTLVVDAFKEHLCLSRVTKEMKWRYSWKDGIRRGVLPIMRHWHETDDDPGLLHMLDSVIARYEHTVMDRHGDGDSYRLLPFSSRLCLFFSLGPRIRRLGL